MSTTGPTRLLFVCGRNRLRSPTAERVFGEVPGIEAESAGVNPDAEVMLDGDLIDWAAVIVFMEAGHRRRAEKRFGPALRRKRVACLNVPDDFEYMQPELIDRLWQQLPRHVPALRGLRGQ